MPQPMTAPGVVDHAVRCARTDVFLEADCRPVVKPEDGLVIVYGVAKLAAQQDAPVCHHRAGGVRDVKVGWRQPFSLCPRSVLVVRLLLIDHQACDVRQGPVCTPGDVHLL
eukprot:9023701-Pyramimonas_sp.AAC.1